MGGIGMKQVLDIEQMKHLQELGLELKETLLYWARAEDFNQRLKTFHYGEWCLQKGDRVQVTGLSHWEFIPAYTLQDVLELLPTEIKLNQKRCWLRMDLSDGYIYYYYEDSNLIEQRVVLFNGGEDIDLLEAAYRILCWCIENGYVKTNKEVNE